MSKAQPLPAVHSFDSDTGEEIESLAKRTCKAGSTMMKLVNYFSSQAEGVAKYLLPDAMESIVEDIVVNTLKASYEAASTTSKVQKIPSIGDWGHKVAVAVTGMGGGASGIATTLLELPATVSIMFASIQRIARSYGFDTDDERVRLECLRVFGSGGPLRQDDDIETSLVASRFILTGTVVHGILGKIAPRFAAVITQKLAMQTVPVIGAVTGAAINVAFLDYYEEMAHIRFRLLKLMDLHGAEAVQVSFRTAVQRQRQLPSE